MPSIATVYSAIKTILYNNVPTSPMPSGGVDQPDPVMMWFQGEQASLPAEPRPMIYIEFLTDPGQIVAFGGGIGGNTHRATAQINAYCFVPSGWGLEESLHVAEQVALLFRSLRTADFSCFAATVHPGGDGSLIKPPGMDSEVDNYFYSVTQVILFFDQLG